MRCRKQSLSERCVLSFTVTFQKHADFYGPKGSAGLQTAVRQRPQLWRGDSAAESAAHPHYADWARLMQRPQSVAAAAASRLQQKAVSH